jgi:hypothetical protein
MFFQFPAPQRLKGMAAAIQSFQPGSIRPFTAQITPLDFMGGYPGIAGHIIISLLIYAKLEIDIQYYINKCLNCLKLEMPKVVGSLRSVFFIKMTAFLKFRHFRSF